MPERTRIPKNQKPVEPLEEQIGQDGDAVLEEVDHDEVILVKPNQESIESPICQEKLANLQFMEDKIVIHIHDTAEKDADPRFEVSVNGQGWVFERGKQYTVPRYIVEGLARAKPVHFRNHEYTDEDGVRNVKWPSSTGLRYGFSVIQDPHPRGSDWLRSVLAQP